jgi:type I restriction enzyme S subunit
MKSWPIKPLRELCEFRHGNTPSKAEPKNWNGSFPWVSPKDMRVEIVSDTEDHLSPETITAGHAAIAKKNSLLVVVRSGILAHTFPVAIAGRDVAFNQDLKSLRVVSPSVTPRFLFRFLQASAPQILTQGTKRGATVHSLQSGFLECLPTPVPPLGDQERIVALLEEADELRKLRAQADDRTAAIIPALFHEIFGEKGRHKSERIRLGQIAEVVSGVAKGRKFNGRQPIEVPYLRVANVQAGHLDLSEIKTIQALPAEVEELGLRKGDVLLTEGGDFDKLGRGAMLEHDLPNCIHQNHVFRVRVKRSALEPIYFAKFLLTSEARGYFLSCAKRTTNLASINMTQLRALPVPVPSLPLQKDFARQVTEIGGLEAKQAASRRRLDDLFQSMLSRAFTGEL